MDPSVRHEGEILIQYPMLALLRKHIKEVQLDPGGADGWTMACKIKILMMIFGLPTLKAIDIFTCNVFKRSTTQACMQLLALQSEVMYTPFEQMDTIHYILSKALVNTNLVEKNIEISKALREETHINLKQSRMQVVQGRPRLRDKLVSGVHSTNTSDCAASVNTWETYTGFCYKHQFPPTLSDVIKTKLYFMASQVHWKNWRTKLFRIAPGATGITSKVADYAVNQPELAVIIKVIENMSMEGNAPFGALNHFRAQCFQSLPVSHVQKTTVTQFLQLYVVVYQSPLIWKELWKHFIGVISVQIIRDCETYINNNPFDEDAFMAIFTPSDN
jgi:hypothetical protein